MTKDPNKKVNPNNASILTLLVTQRESELKLQPQSSQSSCGKSLVLQDGTSAPNSPTFRNSKPTLNNWKDNGNISRSGRKPKTGQIYPHTDNYTEPKMFIAAKQLQPAQTSVRARREMVRKKVSMSINLQLSQGVQTCDNDSPCK